MFELPYEPSAQPTSQSQRALNTRATACSPAESGTAASEKAEPCYCGCLLDESPTDPDVPIPSANDKRAHRVLHLRNGLTVSPCGH